MKQQKYAILCVLCIGVIVVSTFLLPRSEGAIAYLLLSAVVASTIICVHAIMQLLAGILHRNWKGAWLLNLLLTACSIMVGLTLFEVFLQVTRRHETVLNTGPLTLPEEWKKRAVSVEGATEAHYWHGVLHVLNEWGMRRTTPFPSKQVDIFRIMVVGDSLTYGQAVDVSEAYPSLIEEELSKQYHVEVLNLGVSGLQSEDILQVVLTFAPQLQPDLILYGVCLNDFLESRELQRSRENRRAWPFPLPAAFKNFMIQHTLSGEFFEKRYDELLMKFGLRADFFANILRNLYDYQIRFTRDVTLMNYFALQHGLPPVLAMVLDQNPELGERGHQVARLAEKIMVLARMDVISTEAYYTEYDGQKMGISRWDGHPNRGAHRIFAHYFIQALRQHPALQSYRKQ